jgi:hypothetical protein
MLNAIMSIFAPHAAKPKQASKPEAKPEFEPKAMPKDTLKLSKPMKG